MPNYKVVAAVQAKDTGGLDQMVRSGWILKMELIALAAWLGIEMREWSNETGI